MEVQRKKVRSEFFIIPHEKIIQIPEIKKPIGKSGNRTNGDQGPGPVQVFPTPQNAQASGESGPPHSRRGGVGDGGTGMCEPINKKYDAQAK